MSVDCIVLLCHCNTILQNLSKFRFHIKQKFDDTAVIQPSQYSKSGSTYS